MPPSTKDLARFQAYRGNNPITSAIGSILLRLLDQDILGTQSRAINNWSVPTQVNVTNNARNILEEDNDRLAVRICNPSDDHKVYINIAADVGFTAVLYIIQPNETLLIDNECKGRISAISTDSVTLTYRIGKFVLNTREQLI